VHSALFIPFSLFFESILSIGAFCVRSWYLVPFVIIFITLCTMAIFVFFLGGWPEQVLGPVTDISLVSADGEMMVFTQRQTDSQRGSVSGTDFPELRAGEWIEVGIVRLHASGCYVCKWAI